MKSAFLLRRQISRQLNGLQLNWMLYGCKNYIAKYVKYIE